MPPFVVSSLLARLPLSMLQLGVVLLVRGEGHSYAVAGATVACYTIALALAQPMLGRLVDRVGQRRVLIPLALAFPAAVGGVVAGAVAGIHAALLLPLAVAMGATLPPFEPAFAPRGRRWRRRPRCARPRTRWRRRCASSCSSAGR